MRAHLALQPLQPHRDSVRIDEKALADAGSRLPARWALAHAQPIEPAQRRIEVVAGEGDGIDSGPGPGPCALGAGTGEGQMDHRPLAFVE